MRNTELESLRAEMRELRQEISDLESRLCEIETEEDPWAIWPYNWAISGWQKTRDCFHSFQLNKARHPLAHHEIKGIEAGSPREIPREIKEGNELCDMRVLRLM